MDVEDRQRRLEVWLGAGIQCLRFATWLGIAILLYRALVLACTVLYYGLVIK